MENKYKVGEFAKNLGVSTGFLKHHEQYGLLKPHISSSGYRYYTFGNAMQAVQCLRLQNIGFTAKEISEMMNQSTEADIPAKIIAKKRELQNELLLKSEILRFLDSYFPDTLVSSSEDLSSSEDWTIDVPAPFYYLQNATEGSFDPSTTSIEEIVRDWNQYAPITSVCTQIRLTNLNADIPDILSWNMGLVMEKSYADRLNARINDCVSLVTPGKCLIWKFAGERPRKKGREHIPDMLEKPLKICREHNFRITGEIYTFSLFASTAGDANFIQEVILLPLKH